MVKRRRFLQGAGAAAVLGVVGPQSAAQDRFDQDALLDFWSVGTVTLMHFSDLRGQMQPLFLRPPGDPLGRGAVPDLAPEAFRIRYGIGGRTPMDYAHTPEHFVEHARTYGRLGGVANLATITQAIRKQRPQAILLDGGDDFDPLFSPQGHMGNVHANLRTDLRHDINASQVNMFDRGGVRFAVLAPNAVLGSDDLQVLINQAREAGAGAVICMSRQGFLADLALADETEGLDIILSAGGFHALPEPQEVGGTKVIASGSHGCFVTRIDLEITEGEVSYMLHKLIPVFSDLIRPDPTMTGLVGRETEDRSIGAAQALLYRSGAVQSTWDDVICHALMAWHDTQIAFVPGFRWGPSVLPGQAITRGTLRALCIGPVPRTYRKVMTGAQIAALVEAEAEAAFSTDPFARHGRDMIRAGGLEYRLEVQAPPGQRISDLRSLSTGAPLGPQMSYPAAFWAVGEGGGTSAAIQDVVMQHIARHGGVGGTPASKVEIM